MIFDDEEGDQRSVASWVAQRLLSSWNVQLGAIVGFFLALLFGAAITIYFGFDGLSIILACLAMPVSLICGGMVGAVFDWRNTQRRLERKPRREEKELSKRDRKRRKD